jgi:hypothetical protein
MPEPEAQSMEKITRVPGEGALGILEGPSALIKGVSHEGVSCSGQVDADLVRPSRLDAHFQE